MVQNFAYLFTIIKGIFSYFSYIQLKDYGIKTNDAMLEEWLKKADFVRGEFVDFYNWGKLLDQPKMLRQIFQVDYCFNTN